MEGRKLLSLWCRNNNIKIKDMKVAIYTNTQTNEVYELVGVKNIGHAWRLASTVCDRMNWNEDMFSEDVVVRIKK